MLQELQVNAHGHSLPALTEAKTQVPESHYVRSVTQQARLQHKSILLQSAKGDDAKVISNVQLATSYVDAVKQQARGVRLLSTIDILRLKM